MVLGAIIVPYKYISCRQNTPEAVKYTALWPPKIKISFENQKKKSNAIQIQTSG